MNISFACFGLFWLTLLVAFSIGQVSLFRTLLRLLRREKYVPDSALSSGFVINLFVMPLLGALLMLPFGAVAFTRLPLPQGLAGYLVLGAPFSLVAYGVAGIWAGVLVSSSRRSLYRGAMSLVPLVVMAMICLTSVAAVTSLIAMVCLRSFSSGGGSAAAAVPFGLVCLAVPGLPLVNLILLIVHVWRKLRDQPTTGEADQP